MSNHWHLDYPKKYQVFLHWSQLKTPVIKAFRINSLAAQTQPQKFSRHWRPRINLGRVGRGSNRFSWSPLIPFQYYKATHRNTKTRPLRKFFASAETTESCSVLARIALMPEPSGLVKNILCRDRGATDLRLLGRVSSSAASTSIVQRLRIWVVHRGVKTEKAGTLTLDHCFPNGFSQTHACSTHVIQQQPTGILEDSQRNQLISLQRWHNIAIRHDNDVSPVSWHITPNTAKWLLAIVKTFALESLAVLCPMLSFTAILIEELRRKMENQAKP